MKRVKLIRSGLEVIERGEQNTVNSAIKAANIAKKRDAIHAGHLDVRNQDVVRVNGQQV